MRKLAPGQGSAENHFDVVIIGGGPAGLSAALVLGRCRRRVLVCDSGQYRNAASQAVHGFLSRDCIPPSELLEISRRQLEPYGVILCKETVSRISGKAPALLVHAAKRKTPFRARRVLIATGVVDDLPQIENIEAFYGTSVHHCPYCDAWEHRDQPLAAYGHGRPGVGLALSLKTWSQDVVLCTDGLSKLRGKDLADLRRFSIPLYTSRIARLEGNGAELERIVFRNGNSIGRKAIFFNTGQRQGCTLGNDLNCLFTARDALKTDKHEQTSVAGIYAAGDCSRNVQFVAVAAAEGAIAAQNINIELQEEDRQRVR